MNPCCARLQEICVRLEQAHVPTTHHARETLPDGGKASFVVRVLLATWQTKQKTQTC